jgi:hypothetical protein
MSIGDDRPGVEIGRLGLDKMGTLDAQLAVHDTQTIFAGFKGDYNSSKSTYSPSLLSKTFSRFFPPEGEV